MLIPSPPNLNMSFGTTFTFNTIHVQAFRKQMIEYIKSIRKLNITENSEVSVQTPPFNGGV